jgi:hypothetical protein
LSIWIQQLHRKAEVKMHYFVIIRLILKFRMQL